jgi:hypothetical protein
VLGEVREVLDVERGQREPVDKAARRDPGVVDRPRPPASLRAGLKLAPDRRDRLVNWQQHGASPPLGEIRELARSPASKNGPLGQLAQSHERDVRGLAGQPGAESVRTRGTKDRRCYVDVQDDQALTPTLTPTGPFRGPGSNTGSRSARSQRPSPTPCNRKVGGSSPPSAPPKVAETGLAMSPDTRRKFVHVRPYHGFTVAHLNRVASAASATVRLARPFPMAYGLAPQRRVHLPVVRRAW